MWTTENRGRYDRSRLRYPTGLTNDEWSLIGPLIPPAKWNGNKRTVDVREVVNGLMYILDTGCQWAALPRVLPPREAVRDPSRYAPAAIVTQRSLFCNIPATGQG